MEETAILTLADYALFEAIEKNGEKVIDEVKQALENGANLFARDPSSVNDLATPMHLAAKSGNTEVMEILYQHAQNQIVYGEEGEAKPKGNIAWQILNMADKDGSNPIHWAIHCKKASALRWLVNKGVDVDSRDIQGYTPFHWAIYRDDIAMMKFLKVLGANVNAIHPSDGNSTAHLSSINSMNQLAELGVDFSIKNKEGISGFTKIQQGIVDLQKENIELKLILEKEKTKTLATKLREATARRPVVQNVQNTVNDSEGLSISSNQETSSKEEKKAILQNADLQAIVTISRRKRELTNQKNHLAADFLNLSNAKEIEKEERGLQRSKDKFAAENRRIKMPPTERTQIMQERLSQAITARLSQEFKKFKDIENGKDSPEHINDAVKALRIFGAFTNIMDMKMGIKPTLEVTLEPKMGATVEKMVSLSEDIDKNNAKAAALQIIGHFNDSEPLLAKWYDSIVKPAVEVIIRNYEDQIAKIRPVNDQRLIDGMTNRIFNALANTEPKNNNFAPVHSFLNDAAERIGFALSLGEEPGGKKTKLYTTDRQEWTLEGLITKSRIKIVDPNKGFVVAKEEVYINPADNHNGKKYGERWGTPREAGLLYYELCKNKAEADQLGLEYENKGCIII